MGGSLGVCGFEVQGLVFRVLVYSSSSYFPPFQYLTALILVCPDLSIDPIFVGTSIEPVASTKSFTSQSIIDTTTALPISATTEINSPTTPFAITSTTLSWDSTSSDDVPTNSSSDIEITDSPTLRGVKAAASEMWIVASTLAFFIALSL